MDRGDKEKILRQVLTAVANYNGTHLVFDKKFLSYQDEFELEVIELGDDTIRIISKIKKDLKD